MSGNRGIGRLPITVLARAPERGRVKTRLAVELGDDVALALHEALLLDVLARLLDWGSRRLTWAMTGSPEALERGRALVADLPVDLPVALESQGQGDLGARIEEALARRAREGAAASLVVGSDCPFLTDGLLDAAVAAAASGPVLVSAQDGGFVLLAAPALPPGSLAGVEWGTDRALAQTEAALRAAGMPAVVLPAAELDLDRAGDLAPARARLEADPGLAPRTLAFLRMHAEPGAHPG